MADMILQPSNILFHTLHSGIPALALSICMSSIALKNQRKEVSDLNPVPENPVIEDIPVKTGLRALIVGAGHMGHMLAEGLEKNGSYQVVGFVDDSDTANLDNHYPVLGPRADIHRLIKEHRIDEVVVAYAPTWQEEMVQELIRDNSEVKVHMVPTSYETLINPSNMQSIQDIAIITLTPELKRGRELVKRICDIICAIILGILASPLALICALLIKLTSRGPVVFSQERIGYKNRTFRLHKFRTMVQDAEKTTGEIKSKGLDDPRITRAGKWIRALRFDELPQLWDVLRGEMSLVGPRPERPGFVQVYQDRTPTYTMRHLVRPGITGLAQVCGGYHTDARDKLRFDLYYVSHQSLWLDISILVRTILVVLRLQGK